MIYIILNIIFFSNYTFIIKFYILFLYGFDQLFFDISNFEINLFVKLKYH